MDFHRHRFSVAADLLFQRGVSHAAPMIPKAASFMLVILAQKTVVKSLPDRINYFKVPVRQKEKASHQLSV
jgi:hypothetical protein